MKVMVGLLAILLAAPASGQTTNDDTPATESWWDRVGAGFFSDASLREPRSEYEIRAHWTGLSKDDQAAVRARCVALDGTGNGKAPSLQEGSEQTAAENSAGVADEDNAVALADPPGEEAAPLSDTTTTGSAEGSEVQRASPSQTPEPYTGLAGGVEASAAGMVHICELLDKM